MVSVDIDSLWRNTANQVNTKLVPVILLFTGFAIALTWPLIIEPDKLYMITDLNPRDTRDTLAVYLADHETHMGAAVRSGERILDGEMPFVVLPNYALPQTYVIIGALFTLLTPFKIVVFHNLYFLLSIVLAGVFTFALVEEIFEDRETAILAGLLYMSSFYVFNEYYLGHTNQWQLQWIPLILFAVERISTHATRKNVLLLGIAFALQVLSSNQYSVYLSFMLPLYLALRYWTNLHVIKTITFWKRFGASTLLALYLVGPYIFIRLSMSKATQTYSKEANTYVGFVLHELPDLFFAINAPLQYYFRLILLAFGFLILLTASHNIRRKLLPFVVFLIVGFLFTLGPVHPWTPYTFLYDYWPMVNYFRVPYRMFPFVTLGTSVISAASLLYLSDRNQQWTHRGASLILLVAGIQIAIAQYTLQFTEITP